MRSLLKLLLPACFIMMNLVVVQPQACAQQVVNQPGSPSINSPQHDIIDTKGPNAGAGDEGSSVNHYGLAQPVYTTMQYSNAADFTQNQFSKIYPSVVKDYLTIELSEFYLTESKVTCRILNQKGFTVINQNLDKTLNELDLRLLVPGYYSVLLKTEKLMIGNFRFQKAE